MKMFNLVGADGRPFSSPLRGAFGGNRRTKIYGLMNCKTAARYLAAGAYQRNRVFFADEAAALAAGYQACGSCMPGRRAELAGQAARGAD